MYHGHRTTILADFGTLLAAIDRVIQKTRHGVLGIGIHVRILGGVGDIYTT
jgi:hypothetical protein